MMNLLRLFLSIFLGSFVSFAQDAEILDTATKLGSALSDRSISTIAVLLPANDQGYNKKLGEFLSSRLSILLAKRGFSLSSRHAIASIASELKLNDETENSQLFAKLRAQGVQAVVTSNFQVLDENILIDFQLISLDTGNLMGGNSVKLKRSPDIDARLGSPAPEATLNVQPQQEPPPTFSFASLSNSPTSPTNASTPERSVNADNGPAIPPGMTIHIRLIDTISSTSLALGSTFAASLAQPVILNQQQLAPKGADVVGVRIACPEGAKEDLCLTLTKLRVNTQLITLRTTAKRKRAVSSGAGRAKQAAGMGALGAIIGAAAGGARGAAIGGAAGVGLGTATGGGELLAQLPTETLIDFQTR
jgi:hypothetical protein